MRRSSPMVRRRLQPVSAKRRRDWVKRTELLLHLKEVVGYRCEYCRALKPLDGHETRKPRRRYWLNPEYVVMLCRADHARCEASYQQGRLEIPGTRSTGWGFAMVYGGSKFTRRAGA